MKTPSRSAGKRTIRSPERHDNSEILMHHARRLTGEKLSMVCSVRLPLRVDCAKASFETYTVALFNLLYASWNCWYSARTSCNKSSTYSTALTKLSLVFARMHIVNGSCSNLRACGCGDPFPFKMSFAPVSSAINLKLMSSSPSNRFTNPKPASSSISTPTWRTKEERPAMDGFEWLCRCRSNIQVSSIWGGLAQAAKPRASSI
mmetsp:Transcript_83488/g.131942  ORF Transcript_83488/g.131942 Transcript_83488/m.131942 type:complete len:204 (+) Transcript_83488:45-656(+)